LKSQKVEVRIGGMHCAMCANTVAEALKKLEGVITAEVNLATEKAVIEFIPDRLELKDVAKAVEDAGYKYLGMEEIEERKVDVAIIFRIILGFCAGLTFMVLGFTNLYANFWIRLLAFLFATPAFLFLVYPVLLALFQP